MSGSKKNSFYSASGTDGVLWCVAVKIGKNDVQVRDTKDENNTTLYFSFKEWKIFIDGVKKGEFDL